MIKYYENGDVKEERYYIEDEKIDEFQYYVMVGSLK